jgi:hypothetical protein
MEIICLFLTIRLALFILPEFKKFLTKNSLDHSQSRTGYLVQVLERKIPDELRFSNITFKELLNKITKVKRVGWILKSSDLYEEKDYTDIDI